MSDAHELWPGLKFQLIQIFPVTNFHLVFGVAVLEFLQAGAIHRAGPSCPVATPATSARAVVAELHPLLSPLKTQNNHQGYCHSSSSTAA